MCSVIYVSTSVGVLDTQKLKYVGSVIAKLVSLTDVKNFICRVYVCQRTCVCEDKQKHKRVVSNL